MNKYEQIEQIGEGTYGVVIKCRNKQTNEIVAIKKFKEPEDPSDRNYLKITQREVQMLYASKHPFVVKLIEAFKRKTRMYFIFEYCETTVLDLINKFTEYDVKLVTLQLLRAIQHLHSKKIIHRDIKPENLLLTYHNNKLVLKLCDFGFARQQNQQMTDYVATRWYRSPELLLNSKYYGPSVDTWAIGCLIYEMLTSQPLFPGDSDMQTLQMIVQLCGQMTDDLQDLFQRNPRFFGLKLCTNKSTSIEEFLRHKMEKHNRSYDAVELMKQILVIDEKQRPSVDQLVANSYFDEVREQVSSYEKYWWKREGAQQRTQSIPKVPHSTAEEKGSGKTNGSLQRSQSLYEQLQTKACPTGPRSPRLNVQNLVCVAHHRGNKNGTQSQLLTLNNTQGMAQEEEPRTFRYPQLKIGAFGMNVIVGGGQTNYQSFTLPEQSTSNIGRGVGAQQGINKADVIYSFPQLQPPVSGQGGVPYVMRAGGRPKLARRADSRGIGRFMGFQK